MRKLAVIVPVAAMLMLAGCSGQPDTDASAGECAAYVASYEAFTAVSTKQGRSDAEMIEARDKFLAEWRDLAAQSKRESFAELVLMNAENFEEGVSGSAQSGDYYDIFLKGHNGLIEICEDEGHL